MKKTTTFIGLMILGCVSSFANSVNLTNSANQVIGSVGIGSSSDQFGTGPTLSFAFNTTQSQYLIVYMNINTADPNAITDAKSFYLDPYTSWGGCSGSGMEGSYDLGSAGDFNYEYTLGMSSGVTDSDSLILNFSAALPTLTANSAGNTIAVATDSIASNSPFPSITNGSYVGAADLSTTAAPEPSSLALIGLGLAGISLLTKRNWSAKAN